MAVRRRGESEDEALAASPEEAAPATKGERTRQAILDAASALMARDGFEAVTMRTIAAEAGVSLGNAYYYFASKEHLVQAFYQRTHEEHLLACERALRRERSFSSRLRAVLRAHVRSMAPHHGFASALFRSAADPESPLNPFGDESASVRARAIALFAGVVEGSSERIPEDLRADLPRLLWLMHMGVVLFWLHDRSGGHRRTLKLIDGLCGLSSAALTLASLPFAGPLRRQALAVLHDAWGSAS